MELERFFHLDDEDHRLIAARRRDYYRLVFALQVVTVRHLGLFLTDPLDGPPELVAHLAEQLGIDDPTCVKRYTERRETRFEHAREIQSFADVEPELTAWMTGDGPKSISACAVACCGPALTLGEVRGHDSIRMLSRDGKPTGLGDAFAHYGRIFKTLHLLQFVSDEGYRRMIGAQLNVTELATASPGRSSSGSAANCASTTAKS